MHSDVRVTGARRNGSSGTQSRAPLRENLQPQSMSNLQSASDQIARLKLNHHNLRQFDAKRVVSLDAGNNSKRSKGKHKEEDLIDDIPFAPDFVNGDAIGPQINMVRAYVHQVQPSDTLPHILLTYGISSEAFKRANRMWANDSIFTRKVVYLPLSECRRDFEAYESPDLISMDDEDGRTEESNRVQEEVSRVVVPEVGKVDVVKVPSRFLTYFPPSSLPSSSSSFTSPRFQSQRHSEMPLRNVHMHDLLGASITGAAHTDTTSQLPFRRSTDSVGSVTASIEDWVSRNWREWKAKRYERSSLDERWINLR